MQRSYWQGRSVSPENNQRDAQLPPKSSQWSWWKASTTRSSHQHEICSLQKSHSANEDALATCRWNLQCIVSQRGKHCSRPRPGGHASLTLCCPAILTAAHYSPSCSSPQETSGCANVLSTGSSKGWHSNPKSFHFPHHSQGLRKQGGSQILQKCVDRAAHCDRKLPVSSVYVDAKRKCTEETYGICSPDPSGSCSESLV